MKTQTNLKDLHNAKEKDYRNLGNGVIPTKSDLETFEKWKKKQKNRMLFTVIYTLFILVLVGCILLAADLEKPLAEKLFVILVYVIFAWAEVVMIKKYLRARHWKMEYCNYGKVIEKYCFGSSNKNRRTNIIVLLNEKKLNITTCSITEYRRLELNDEVIAFSVDNNNMYIAKKVY